MKRSDRDIVDAIIDVGLGLLAIAVVVGATLLLAATMCGCAPPTQALQRSAALVPSQTPLERAVASRTLDAWAAAGLLPPKRECRLAELRIEEPETHAAYLARCPYQPSWECLAWSAMAPVAVMHPLLARDRVGAHAVHALIHALMHCSGESRSSDSYDGAHRHPKAWEAGGPDSVETRGERALDAAVAFERVTRASSALPLVELGRTMADVTLVRSACADDVELENQPLEVSPVDRATSELLHGAPQLRTCESCGQQLRRQIEGVERAHAALVLALQRRTCSADCR